MTTKQATLEEKLTAISTHYRNPDGTPCSTLAEVEALPDFQARFPAAMKVERDDSLAATIHVIDSLLDVEESLDAVPCWVLNPDDYDVRPKAGVTMDGDEVARGVRVVLPGGAQRFLRSIDPAVAATLKPGQPVKMRGACKRVTNLLERRESWRLGKDAELVAEPHQEPMPHLGLDYFVGATVKENGWGPYSLDGDRNVLRGSFGPQFYRKKHDNYNGPLYATLEFGGCAWTSPERGTTTMFVNTPDGYEGIGEISQAWAAEHFGVPVASERDDYTEKMRGRWILSRCNGSVLRSLKTKELGGEEKVAAEIDDLRSNGLLKVYGDRGTELLSIPKAHAEACKAAGDWPHIEFSDQKVHDVKITGGSGYVSVMALPLDGKLEFNLMEMTLPRTDGSTYTTNEGLWSVPVDSIESKQRRVAADDPSLAELRRLKATKVA